MLILSCYIFHKSQVRLGALGKILLSTHITYLGAVQFVQNAPMQSCENTMTAIRLALSGFCKKTKPSFKIAETSNTMNKYLVKSNEIFSFPNIKC